MVLLFFAYKLDFMTPLFLAIKHGNLGLIDHVINLGINFTISLFYI